MQYKLIAMDLDGTLNNSQKRITEKTYNALMRAQQQGIRLALASARPSPGLFKERDILHLQALLTDCQSGKKACKTRKNGIQIHERT